MLLLARRAELANATRPGQYVMAIPPSAQTAATALAVYEAEGKLASLLFFVTGNRTRELCELRIGDRLDVVGPLGNGFDCSVGARDAAIVAGGVGIASVLLCAQALLRAGARVRLFYGARTASLLVEAQRFADVGCELVVTTDDGSAGERGFVTDALARARKARANLRLRSVADAARGRAHRAASSACARSFRSKRRLDAASAAVGAASFRSIAYERAGAEFSAGASEGGSDVVYARICREGPVFWADELRW